MLRIPGTLWTHMLDVFRQAPMDVEQVAFLDGYRCGDVGLVTTLVFPDAVCTSGNYSVSADAMHEAGRHLQGYEMVRLAQVHTHPADWVGLSLPDEILAYSQRDGAISIVLPHGGKHGVSARSIGVHERTPSGWCVRAAEDMLVFVPDHIDLRSKRWTQSRPAIEGTSEDASRLWDRILRGCMSSLTRATRRR